MVFGKRHGWQWLAGIVGQARRACGERVLRVWQEGEWRVERKRVPGVLSVRVPQGLLPQHELHIHDGLQLREAEQALRRDGERVGHP